MKREKKWYDYRWDEATLAFNTTCSVRDSEHLYELLETVPIIAERMAQFCWKSASNLNNTTTTNI